MWLKWFRHRRTRGALNDSNDPQHKRNDLSRLGEIILWRKPIIIDNLFDSRDRHDKDDEAPCTQGESDAFFHVVVFRLFIPGIEFFEFVDCDVDEFGPAYAEGEMLDCATDMTFFEIYEKVCKV